MRTPRLGARSGGLALALPPIFVVIWSTGFVVARSIAGRADPNLFLCVRFGLALLVFASVAALRRERLPDRSMLGRLFVVGALLQGLYLGPGFWAVGQGLQPGVMALVGALQPPLTAVLAWRLFGERASRRALVGIGLGVAGVALAVSPLLAGSPGGIDPTGAVGAADVATAPGAGIAVVLAATVSIGAITAGTLLQRGAVREVPLATASAVQCAGGVAVTAALALLLGEARFESDATTLLALAWAVLVLSVGGFTLLIVLVRTGGATRASSLMFLAPPLAAVLAWMLFDDALAPVQLAGFALALVGVTLARR